MNNINYRSIFVSKDLNFMADQEETIKFFWLDGINNDLSGEFVAPYDGNYNVIVNKELKQFIINGPYGCYYTVFMKETNFIAKSSGCECGAHSVKSDRHSYYCKLANHEIPF